MNGVCGADLSVLFPGGRKQLSWRDFGGTSRKGNEDMLPTPVASNGDNKSAEFMATSAGRSGAASMLCLSSGVASSSK